MAKKEKPNHEFERWIPHLPSATELRMMAIQIFYEENPHCTTNPEEYELRAPEGQYYQKARKRIMMGYVEVLEYALKAYREEIDRIVEILSEIETVVQ